MARTCNTNATAIELDHGYSNKQKRQDSSQSCWKASSTILLSPKDDPSYHQGLIKKPTWLCATNLVRMLLFSIQKIEVTQKKVEIKVSESSRIGSVAPMNMCSYQMSIYTLHHN